MTTGDDVAQVPRQRAFALRGAELSEMPILPQPRQSL